MKNHLPNGNWPLQETSFSGINGAVSGVAASFVTFGLTHVARNHELAQLMEANNKILLGTMETMMDEKMETMKTTMETMMDEKLMKNNVLLIDAIRETIKLRD